MAAGREQMVDDIILLLQNATSTELALIDDNAIVFGLRPFHQFAHSEFDRGIMIFPQRGPLDALTLSAAKIDFNQTFEIQLFVQGHDPDTDSRRAITISEEIEETLYSQTNIKLANGGECLGFPEWIMGPPVTREANLTLHFVLMEVLYRKTLTF